MVENLDIMKMLQNGAPSDVILLVIGYVVNMVVQQVKKTNANTDAIFKTLTRMENLLQLYITSKTKRSVPRIKIPSSVEGTAGAIREQK